MLTTRMTPKMRESPLARRKRRAPYDSPLNVWRIQKTDRMPRLPQAQQAGGIVAHDAILILSIEPDGLRLDGGARPLIPHVEAEIGAEHHAIRAHGGHEIAQRPRVVADDVVGEATQVGAERLLRALLRLRAHPLAVPEPAVQVRQRSARMGQAHLELGQPVEDAAEDEVGGGDGGVEGIAEEVGEVERLQTLGADDAKRMQERGHAKAARAPDSASGRG